MFEIYNVQKGDTIDLISAKYNITPSNLYKLNGFRSEYVPSVGSNIIVPKNNVVLLTRVPKDWFIVWAIVSTSLVTLDKVSPIALVSKYCNGNLLIFLEIFLLRLLANLLATIVISIDSM